MNTHPVLEYINELPFLMHFQEMTPRVVTVEGAYDASLQQWSPTVSANGTDTGTATTNTSGSSDSDSD